ncbi:MAG: GNAT family N-acetyltransferase [Azospirillaceae bacterium]
MRPTSEPRIGFVASAGDGDALPAMTRALAPPATRGRGPEVEIVAMDRADAGAVAAFLEAHPTVHFRDWEAPLVADAVTRPPAACFIARRTDGRIGGAVIAGSFGVRGTISHIAVAEDLRRRGIATALARHALDALRRNGILRVFLFTLDESPEARVFWRSLGFHPTEGETTLEADL